MRALRVASGRRSPSSCGQAARSARTRAARYRGRPSRGRSPRARPRTGPTGPCRRGSGCSRTTVRRRPATRGAWELRLSHWTGAAPRARTLDGLVLPSLPPSLRRLTYRDKGVFGFRVDTVRRPARHVRPEHLRRHLRLRRTDRLEAREQLPDPRPRRGLLLRLLPARSRTGSATGTRYRATVIGPGVTPDVMWQGPAPGAFDAAADAAGERRATRAARGRPALRRQLTGKSTALDSLYC